MVGAALLGRVFQLRGKTTDLRLTLIIDRERVLRVQFPSRPINTLILGDTYDVNL